jgi:lipopolysaccharide exporter
VKAGVAARAGAAMRWRAVQLVGAQSIYFLRMLILARLLAPDAFGLLAIATIAVSVLMRLSEVGMIPALVQRRDATPEQYDAAWTLGLTRASLVAASLVVAAPFIATMFGEPQATSIIRALAMRPLVDACVSIGVARLHRDLKFRELAFIQVPNPVVDLVTAVATAPVLGVWALVAGALAGSTTTAVLSYVLAPNRPRLRFDWAQIAPLVSYGRWVLAIGVAGLAGTFAIQLGISRTLGAEALGLYFLAVKVAFLPIEASSSVVGSVAFPVFVQLKENPAGSTRVFATLLAGLALILVPGYALIFVLSPYLVQVLGERWAGTAPVIQILAVAGITAIVGELLGPFLMGRGRSDRAFALELVQTGVLLVVLVPCLLLLQVRGGALAWLIGNVAAMAVSIVWVRRMLPGAFSAAGRRLGAAILTALVAAGVAGLAARPFSGAVGLVLGALAGVAAGTVVLWRLDAPWNLRLHEFLDVVLNRAP